MSAPQKVRAKKSFGQHFLNDTNVAIAIVDALQMPENCNAVLEIGPGMGVLTQFLIKRQELDFYTIDIDRESIAYLKEHFPTLKNRIIEGDFLQLNLQEKFKNPLAIIGNFPYNISTQILFTILENKNHVPLMVGMFQKEVAERIASAPGNRDYGILSVLLQPWFEIEYLFTVLEHQFDPPPRVKSAVIRMRRNDRMQLEVDEQKFKNIVKLAFNQRRKTLRNALKSILPEDVSTLPFLDKRAEQLSWQQFVLLLQKIN